MLFYLYSVDISPLILNGVLEMLLQLLNSTITYKPLPIESLLHTKVHVFYEYCDSIQ